MRTIRVDHRLRTDPQGEVEILRRFWPFETEPPHTDLTPPVLVYADLPEVLVFGKQNAAFLDRKSDHFVVGRAGAVLDNGEDIEARCAQRPYG